MDSSNSNSEKKIKIVKVRNLWYFINSIYYDKIERTSLWLK